MAQEKGSDQGDLGSPPAILDKLGDNDWGDDWEAAFQSEDQEADEEELAGEFSFDDDEEKADRTTGPSPAEEVDNATNSPGGGPGLFSRLAGIAQLLPALLRLPQNLWRSFQGLGTPQKIVGGVIFLTLLLSLLLFYTLTRPPVTRDIILPDDPFGLRESLEIAAPAEPAATPPPAEIPEPTASAAEPEPPPSPPPPEPDRHRLSLPDFLIPVPGDTGHGDVFLHLDLTLTVQAPPGEPLKPVITGQLRESVYNFYRRQDPATLRRYSLARGDMLRDLRLWLEEQHPELAADSISFDRYWIN
ncbi:hypothetical protein [Desulfurivibrio dismutans]|uniref:hypothetical protein n=1 Tax=Desulfurivibrio dismutans TaxID=1398908 RepID=UPI0023DB9EE9|nr:hypothetical protein [Desulfurivibrio alkaliphilus]MDF1615215.1 hypothetical protein [Desulfurivibrio alkaliphilus]